MILIVVTIIILKQSVQNKVVPLPSAITSCTDVANNINIIVSYIHNIRSQIYIELPIHAVVTYE